MELVPENPSSWPPPARTAELVEHLELVPGTIRGRRGDGEAGARLIVRTRDRSAGTKTTSVVELDVETMRHLAALLPDMCLAAVEEFNVQRMLDHE